MIKFYGRLKEKFKKGINKNLDTKYLIEYANSHSCIEINKDNLKSIIDSMYFEKIKNVDDMERILKICDSSNIYSIVKMYKHGYTCKEYELLIKMRELSDSYMKIGFEEKYSKYRKLIESYLMLISSDDFDCNCKEGTRDKMNYNSIALLMDCYKAVIELESFNSSNVSDTDNVIYVNFNK